MAITSSSNAKLGDTSAEAALRAAGLRPTVARKAVYARIFAGRQPKHWDAASLAGELEREGVHVALATVYNTLEALAARGVVRKINLDGQRSVFDTDTAPHLHIVLEDAGSVLNLHDTDELRAFLARYVDDPDSKEIDVVIRVRSRPRDESLA